MKITDRLVGDHKTFRKLIRDIENIMANHAQDRDMERLTRLIVLFEDHLLIHSWCEGLFYYPAIAKEIQSRPHPLVTQPYMAQLEKEHNSIDAKLHHLDGVLNSNQPWEEPFRQFARELCAHMDKEERELFPDSEEVLGADRLNQLSDEVEAHRSEAPPITQRN